MFSPFVIPAQAGTHGGERLARRATVMAPYPLVPACAGMTKGGHEGPINNPRSR